MKNFWISVGTCLVLIFAISLQAKAQGAIASVNGKCPSGWSESRGYCTPRSGRNEQAVHSANGRCPSGWRSSYEDFCVPRNQAYGRPEKAAPVAARDGRCPNNRYLSGDSCILP